MEEATKKEALRLFTYGLYIVTCGDTSRRNAFTANWLSQVSFDPPLVALSVENTATSLAIIQATQHFAIAVLDADQRELAGRLGKPYSRHPEKLDGLTFGQGDEGTPVLLDGLAWVECSVTGSLPAGDSTLVVGRVVGAAVLRGAEPLTMRAAGFKHAG